MCNVYAARTYLFAFQPYRPHLHQRFFPRLIPQHLPAPPPPHGSTRPQNHLALHLVTAKLLRWGNNPHRLPKLPFTTKRSVWTHAPHRSRKPSLRPLHIDLTTKERPKSRKQSNT